MVHSAGPSPQPATRGCSNRTPASHVRAPSRMTRARSVTGPGRSGCRADQLSVARTCVLIKTASHPACTCVLITCMSQANYGRWPFSDGSCRVRQNGTGDRRGRAAASASQRPTCRIGLGGRALSSTASADERLPPGGLHRRAGRARPPTAALSPPRSLGPRGDAGATPGGPAGRNGSAAGSGTRLRPASARAPCRKAINRKHWLAQFR